MSDQELDQPDRDPHTRERRADRITIGWLWEHLVPLLALALAAWAVTSVQGKADRAESKFDQQREGRRVAIDVLCGGLYGVERAGRLTLLDQLPSPAPQGRRQTDAQQKIRMLYAESYARVITEAVVDQAGVDLRSVLRPDGLVDCDRLRKAAQATG